MKETPMENFLGRVQVARRKSLNEEVYESLKKSILHGKLKGGQRLIEEQLAHQIGISRTPVREAFQKLERDELVIRLPKRGYAIREFTKEDVEEIFGISSVLESYASYLATLHITPERIAALNKKIDELEKTYKNKKYERAGQLLTEFHDLLYKSCRSKKLLEMIHNFRDYLYRYQPALLQIKDGFKYSVEDHRRMVGAMKKKNPGLVERIVRKHLARGKELILKEIKEGRIAP
jgi:DNA-binding GntR family transcriptional regulator